MKTVNEGRPVCRLTNYRKKNYTQLMKPFTKTALKKP